MNLAPFIVGTSVVGASCFAVIGPEAAAELMYRDRNRAADAATANSSPSA